MKIKRVLFVDDGDINSIIDGVSRKLESKGWSLKYEKLDLSGAEFFKEENGNHSLDFQVIKRVICDSYIDQRYDLVACDFNYANDKLNGYDVIRWLKNTANGERRRIRKAKFIIYSSESDKFIGEFNGEALFKLIKLKIDDFYYRGNLVDNVPKLLLKEDATINLSNFLVEELERYSDMKFKNTYPRFSGKSLGDIAREIDSETYHGMAFQKEIMELTLAHLVKLNEE